MAVFVPMESRRFPLRRKLELDVVQIARVVRGLGEATRESRDECFCRGDVEGSKVEREDLQGANETHGCRARRAQTAVAVHCDRCHNTDERWKSVTVSLVFRSGATPCEASWCVPCHLIVPSPSCV